MLSRRQTRHTLYLHVFYLPLRCSFSNNSPDNENDDAADDPIKHRRGHIRVAQSPLRARDKNVVRRHRVCRTPAKSRHMCSFVFISCAERFNSAPLGTASRTLFCTGYAVKNNVYIVYIFILNQLTNRACRYALARRAIKIRYVYKCARNLAIM